MLRLGPVAAEYRRPEADLDSPTVTQPLRRSSHTDQVEKGLDRVIHLMTQEIEHHERVRDAAAAEALALRRRRAVLQRLTSHETAGVAVREGLPSKPAAVVALLREHRGRALRLIEIRNALIERGFMGTEKREVHALEVAVRALEARGAIERIRRGMYRLADVAGARASDDDSG